MPKTWLDADHAELHKECNIDRLKCYISKVNIKLQPDITEDKISAFIRGESITDDKRRSCLSVYSRMDVLPDGGVSSCKHFPEFTVGNLNNQSVKEIWNSSDLNKIIDKNLAYYCHLH